MNQDSFNLKDYERSDLAGTYRQLEPGPERDNAEIERDFEALCRDGYVVIERLLSLDECHSIKLECAKLLEKTGRNPFEGHKTQRLYNVLGKTRASDRLADHPRILGLMDRIFEPGFLLSQSQVINILPGEQAQAIHFDDSFYKIPRPRPAMGAATVWAIDAFTEDNGATVVVPGSHLWGDEREPTAAEQVPAIMPAGSVIFFLGTTWHGGGANRSDTARFAITHQYCNAYLRQQENYCLELGPEVVRGLTPELQALIGYSIYPPFMGMVDGQHPLRLLRS